ncbi:MAG: hypothetical protein JSS70_00080 [Bacteroidetes bacterium]|nr:hypothetical protein [Bacteroidota bacterium]
MKRRIIFGTAVLIGLMSAFVLFSAAKMEANTSESETSKETMEDCCKKESDKSTDNSPDFESLPGKFFSSVFIN